MFLFLFENTEKNKEKSLVYFSLKNVTFFLFMPSFYEQIALSSSVPLYNALNYCCNLIGSYV